MIFSASFESSENCNFCVNNSSGACVFEPVNEDSNECPINADLAECFSDMATDTLCDADQALPNGTSNYDINNCGLFDVFRCKRGNITSLLINERHYLFDKYYYFLYNQGCNHFFHFIIIL